MKIEQIRVYAEVLEQGIDFKEYIENSGIKCSVINIYSHKARGEISETDSIVTRIRKSKDVDVLITAIQLLLPKRTAAKILTKRNYKKNYGSYIIFGAAL